MGDSTMKQPQLKPKHDFDWPTIRKLWESGRSAYEIARMPGMPSHTAIDKRKVLELWSRHTEVAIQERVAEKVAGLVASCNIAEREKLIDSEAGKRAAIERRHRDEPNDIRVLLYNKINVMSTQPDPDVKEIKAVSDCMLAIQTMERKAYRLDSQDLAKQHDVGARTYNIVVVDPPKRLD